MLTGDIKRLTQELDIPYRTNSATAANQQRVNHLVRLVDRQVSEQILLGEGFSNVRPSFLVNVFK
ncbi:MAG: hypothetical protein DLM72_08560 [Candidatus Nitrosopolaris wilkensis]|nr:MAG: hypothetical protein DLM72_08560 [Candidatus Nitrosopolaris wilkensis]